jgi:hypothetical protein
MADKSIYEQLARAEQAASAPDFIGGSNQEHPSEINPEIALESKPAPESAEELELEPDREPTSGLARDFIPSCQRRRKNASVFRSKNTSVKLKTRSRNLREPARLKAAANRFADKTKDLQALRDAVVDAASIGAGLWLSYLFVLFYLLYLLIAAASVTHRDLFFENPVKLPFLNVDLPLVFFFWLGPLLFLIAHTYVLLHFVLLAGKVRTFHIDLGAQISDDVRSGLRRQQPSNIFVHFQQGPRTCVRAS